MSGGASQVRNIEKHLPEKVASLYVLKTERRKSGCWRGGSGPARGQSEHILPDQADTVLDTRAVDEVSTDWKG